MVAVADNFNRANGALGTSSSGDVWSVLTGSVTIYNNRALTGNARAIAVLDAGAGNVTVEADCGGGAKQGGYALYFRVTDANNWWRLGVSSDFTTATATYTWAAVLQKCVAGTVQTMANLGYGAPPTHLKVVATGGSIVASTQFSGALNTVTDTFNQKATKHGVGYSEATTYSNGDGLDNFIATPSSSSSTLSATAALNVSGDQETLAVAQLTGVAQLSSSGSSEALGIATLTASSSLSAQPTVSTSAAVFLSAVASLAALAKNASSGAAALSASAGLNSSATTARAGFAQLAAQAALNAVGVVTAQAGATLTAVASMVSPAVDVVPGASVLSANAAFVGSTSDLPTPLAATASLTAGAQTAAIGLANLVATATMRAAATTIHFGTFRVFQGGHWVPKAAQWWNGTMWTTRSLKFWDGSQWRGAT